MNQNEITLVFYPQTNVPNEFSCTGCIFNNQDFCSAPREFLCMSETREDKQEGIWRVKEEK